MWKRVWEVAKKVIFFWLSQEQQPKPPDVR